MRPPIDLSVIVLTAAARGRAVVAYVKDPGLPAPGAQTGLKTLWFVLPRLVPALLLAGLLQVVIPQAVVARYFGREAGFRGIVIASLAGMLPPGGPIVTVPFLVALASSPVFPVLAGWLTTFLTLE